MYRRGRRRCFSPNRGHTVNNYCRKYAVGSGDHDAGRLVVLGGLLALQRSRRRPCGSSGHRGVSCRGYRAPCLTWRRLEGPAGGSPAPVKVWAAFEGRAHANRGFCSGEGTRSWQHSGGNSAEHVLYKAPQVPTMAPQCRGWLSSDRSWRTGLQSQLLRGMVA